MMPKTPHRLLAPLAVVLSLGAISATADAGPRRDRDERFERRGPPAKDDERFERRGRPAKDDDRFDHWGSDHWDDDHWRGDHWRGDHWDEWDRWDHRDRRWRGRSGPPAGPADLDRDGFVTRRELRRYHRADARAAAFRLDKNRDGWLSPREMRFATGYWSRFRNDLDRDGVVTRGERWLARRGRRAGIPTRRIVQLEMIQAERRFDRLDRNHDGRLSRRELRPGFAWR